MFEVVFLGVGEAFDEKLPNTSILVRFEDNNTRATVLLDCGFTAAPQFWREESDPDRLDGVWISHFHGDHFFGLPALLVRFIEEGRKRALTILGQKGIDQLPRKVLDLAYPRFYKKINFPLKFLEIEPQNDIEAFGLRFRTAENAHSERNLALRIEAGGTSIYYSGDGNPTAECMAIAKGCQLIIQESFEMEKESHGHGTVVDSVNMAKNCGASHLALVHVKRHVRSKVISEVKTLWGSSKSLTVMIPEPGTRVTL
jgi:ribonuclease Z